MVLLNKLDLFEQRLTESRLSRFFPKYTGGSDSALAYAYVRDEFLKRGRIMGDRLKVLPSTAVRGNTIEAVLRELKSM